jgi:hypothetical protein
MEVVLLESISNFFVQIIICKLNSKQKLAISSKEGEKGHKLKQKPYQSKDFHSVKDPSSSLFKNKPIAPNNIKH